MAAGMSIEIRGLDKLRRKVSTDKFKSACETGLKAGAVEFKGYMAKYPTQRIGRKQPFVSDRQRRGFFAKLRAGRIEVPYRRGISPGSERLGQRWTVAMRKWSEAVVGNNARYAQLVQSAALQVRFHKEGGWQTDQQMIEAHSGDIAKKIATAIRGWLNG